MRGHRRDANHAAIVARFRACGASVLDVADLKNCCDLVVAHRGRTWAIEIKDGTKPPSRRKLTDGERTFAEQWRKNGQWRLVESEEDALALLGEAHGDCPEEIEFVS